MDMWEAQDEERSTPVEGTMPSHEDWMKAQMNFTQEQYDEQCSTYEHTTTPPDGEEWCDQELSQADSDHLDTLGYARGE